MLIQAEHLTLMLNNNSILKDVSLHLSKGEIYGLLGPNGAGKSSTIACLLGLHQIDSGELNLLGIHKPGKDVMNKIGVMPENAGFYEWMTAPQYLQWYAKLFSRTMDSDATNKLLASVGLEIGSTKSIIQFSRGMKQRLAVARALVNEPGLLIMDEPSNGLDPKGRREVHDLFLKLASEKNTGILLCTHLLDDVDRLCDRIGIIQDGRSVIESPINDLISSNQATQKFRIRTRIQEPDEEHTKKIHDLDHVIALSTEGGWWHLQLSGTANPAEIWKQLLELGIEIQEIYSEGNGLEDIYLSLTGNFAKTNHETAQLEVNA